MVIVMRSISCLSRVLCCLKGLCLCVRNGVCVRMLAVRLFIIIIIIIIGGCVICARAPASQSSSQHNKAISRCERSKREEMIYLVSFGDLWSEAEELYIGLISLLASCGLLLA